MKLLRAEFQNFRMLRDLRLEFSTESDRSLTVIRAANESGKTTILHGLQWALYGDSALPGSSVQPFDPNARLCYGQRELEATTRWKPASGFRDYRHDCTLTY